MCHLMFYILLAGLFTSLAHVDVRMIVVQSHTDEKLYLDNYTAHTTFVTWLKNEAYWKIRNGISYGLCHLKNEPEISMYRMNAIKYTVLHLFQALSSGDFAYAQLLLNITSKHNKTSPETLFSWLESNFQFPQHDLYNIVKNFVSYCNDLYSSCSYNVKKLIQLISDKYFMADIALLEHDLETVKWLVEHNVTNISPRAIELLWINSKGRDILNEILYNIKTESYGQSSKLLSKVHQNESFIDFIIEKRHFKLIHKLLKSNELNPCIALISAFVQNVPEVVTIVEIHKGLTNLSCNNSTSGRLLYPSLNAGRVDLAKILIESGTNVDFIDHEVGLTPLYKSLLTNATENSKFLILFEANFNSTLETGKTLLHIAVERNDIHVIEKLLYMGASPLVTDANGVTQFQLAIEKDNSLIVEAFCKRINDVDKVIVNGLPILHYVVLIGSIKMTRTILGTGIDVNNFHGENLNPLMLASKINDTIKILFLAEYEAEIGLIDQSGNTALHIAVTASSYSAIKVLILLGANINASNNQGQSPLYVAVKDNNVEIIQYLVEKGADITQKTENGGTLLHLAAAYGSVEGFEKLSTYNLILNSTNDNNETPLYVAVKSNKPHIIDLIASRGGNISEKSKFGNTLLHLAVENENVEAMKELLKLGLDQNLKNSNGSSALTNAILKNNFIMLKEMLTHAKNLVLETELIILAASNGCINSLKALKDIWEHYGLNIHIPNWRDEKTPLTEAVIADQVEVMRYLKENGANFSFRSLNGDSLVHLAAKAGSLNVLKNLIEWKMEVDSHNYAGETALWLSTKHGHLAAMKLLKDNGADIHILASTEPWEGGSLLLPAAYSGNTESVLWLISNNLIIDHRDLLGETALHVASELGHEEVVIALLDEGASVDIIDIIGETPLHKSVINGHNNVSKILIEYGAALDSKALRNLTPLHQACAKGNLEIVDILLKNGAEKDIGDDSGWTPLHWATYYGYSSIVGKLLHERFNTSIKNDNGLKPQDLAYERNHQHIVML